jgi:uroporphyrinogen-III decarboxylase
VDRSIAMGKTSQELYQEREKRVLDVMALKKPDRVPIMVMFSFFPAKYMGMTIQDVMYDPDKLWNAQWKVMMDFEQDMEQNPFPLRFTGPLLDSLDFKQIKWPGHGVGPNVSYQFVEGEYMKADEYDHYLLDPTDFMIRKYWPRIFGNLKGLENLPPLHNIVTYSMGMPTGFAPFNTPEVHQALDTFRKAGEKSAKLAEYSKNFGIKTKEAGFPMQTGPFCQVPFDTLGDYFRGTRGLMLDMYRRPEKVIKACEKLLTFMIEMAVIGAKNTGNPRVFIPIHKGLDGFMSEDQFKKFFWPTTRDLFTALIDNGLNPCPLWEGNCTSRIELIKDIPAGKAIYSFESTDMLKAKKILGDTVCIRGGVPLSILATGTPDDVRACCKKLIDELGKDGGYIMDASAGLDDAKVENVKAMFDFTKEYGVYK